MVLICHEHRLLYLDFGYVGAALSPHKTYDVCCVMDFAGAVKALDDVVKSDCEVTTTQPMTDAFKKVLLSIPSSTPSASVDDHPLMISVNNSLKDGAEV